MVTTNYNFERERYIYQFVILCFFGFDRYIFVSGICIFLVFSEIHHSSKLLVVAMSMSNSDDKPDVSKALFENLAELNKSVMEGAAKCSTEVLLPKR